MSDRANVAYETATNAASTFCWEVQQAALEAVREAVERGEDKEEALMAYVDDLTATEETEYCHSCGQMGCGHNTPTEG